jgi:hypothetical protein
MPITDPVAATGLPESQNTSRRSALRLLTATVLTTTLTGASIGFPEADYDLLAREPVLNALIADWRNALHDHSTAERVFYDEAPEPPVFNIEHHTRLCGEEQRAHLTGWGPRVRTYEVEIERLKRKHDLDGLELRAGRLDDVAIEHFLEIAEYRATTIAGLKCKARLVEHDNDIRDSLVRDVLTLKI